MHRNLTNLIFVAGILFIITACVCRSDRDQEPSAPQNSANTPANTVQPTTKSSPVSQEKHKDEGDFLVEYVAITNPKYAAIDKQVKDEKLLEKAADRLNRSLILPHNIVLRARDCDGDVNAYYTSENPSVTVCYELMEHFFKVFRSGGASEDKAYAKMFDAVRFVFLHEIGHALIDTYKLPVTGNEEDAADRCSSYINLEELGDDGLRAVFAAADAFAIEAKQGTPKDRNMADEHLLQEQRFYNSLCMIYGSNPSKHTNIVTEGYLPKERAVRCQTEYQRTVESWVNLLQPWRKG